MSIINFGAFNQYSATGVKVTLSTGTYIEPAWKGVTPRWIYTPVYYTSFLEVPVNKDIEKQGRLWQRIQPISSVGSTARSIAFIIDQDSIDPSLRIPGNTVSFGFKFATAPGAHAAGKYLGTRIPGTTAVTTLVMLAETIGPNQMRWLDFIITYNEDETTDVKIYSNKDLVSSFTAKKGEFWGAGVGNIATSLNPNSYNANYGFYMNDFLTSVDTKDDPNPTSDSGPITVKTLFPTTARATGTWTPPAGKTVLQALSSLRKTAALTITDAESIKSDPHTGTLTTTFTYPVEEPRPILAFQETMVAKSLLSESSMLQWQRIKDGKPVGTKTSVHRFNDGLGFEIKTDVVTPREGNTVVTPEDINSRGMVVNSAKKTIAKD